LLVIEWVVVSDSQSILLSTNMFMPEQCFVGSHSRLYLELLVVTVWVSWEFKALLVKEPALTLLVVAMVPG